MAWNYIDQQVIYDVLSHRLSKHELDVIDAVWAATETPLEDALKAYELEMRNAREEEI